MNLTKVIDKSDIKNRIKWVSEEINKRYRGKEVVVFYIEKGGKPFFNMLCKELDFHFISENISVKSYNLDKSGELKWIKKPTLDVAGKVCLLIDDILDTGQTISKVREYLLGLGAKQCDISVAIDKHERRIINIEPAFKLFDVDKGFLVGFGMDYDQKYRDLEDIYEIEI